MQQYDVIIIGASAAGVTAAITARRHYPEKSILVLRKEKLVPIPCGIPYTFGVVGTPERNLIPADGLLSKNSIATVVGEVTEIDRAGGTVTTSDDECFGYQRLIIATMTADDIATFQTGTHPALTASPIAYQLVNAAEAAIGNIKKEE